MNYIPHKNFIISTNSINTRFIDVPTLTTYFNSLALPHYSFLEKSGSGKLCGITKHVNHNKLNCYNINSQRPNLQNLSQVWSFPVENTTKYAYSPGI